MTSEANILRLGRDLADALDPSDIVGRWLAHHLAALITRCEAAPGDEELASSTRDVILKFWEHKCGGRFLVEPYGYVRPVLKAVARLEPNPQPWTYYSTFREADEPPASELIRYPLLQAACDVDREVGNLIRLSVAIASKEAISREEPWVIAGASLAESEEDRAVQAIERFVRRLQERASTGPQAPTDSDSATADADTTIPADHDVVSGRDSPNRGAPIDRDDALVLSIQAAIERCRSLFDQIERLGTG